MRRFPHFRRLSPELLFGLFQALVWLLLAFQVTAGVVAPLAQSATAKLAHDASVQ